MEKFNKFLIFLMPIFLALPDIAINTGAINLRIDDLLIYIFFFSAAFDIIQIKKNYFHKIQYYLFFYAFISFLIVAISNPMLISNYNVIKAIGSLPFLLTFPFILQHPEYRKVLFKGALIGGFIYLISLGNNYSTILIQSEIIKTSGAFKREISFDTLNPNAVAGIGLILGWLNILNFYENNKKKSLIIGSFLLVIPFFIYARGYSVGVIIAVLLLIILQKKKLKHYFYFAMIGLIGFYVFVNFIDDTLLKSATDVDVETGKGFSGRYELWANGIDLVSKNPVLGSGFSTEAKLFRKYYDGHMSHQILLRYAIELGVINLFIFLLFIISLLINRYIKYRKTFNKVYLVQMATLLCYMIADMSSQLLYFNKYTYIIYAMVLYNINRPSNTNKYNVN